MSQFLGAPVEVTLHPPYGTITGTVTAIDGQQGSVTLQEARHSLRPDQIFPTYTLQKSDVAGLRLLALGSNGSSHAPTPPAQPARAAYTDPAIISMGTVSPSPMSQPIPAAPTLAVQQASPQLSSTSGSATISGGSGGRRRRRQQREMQLLSQHPGSEADESTALPEDDLDTDPSITGDDAPTVVEPKLEKGGRRNRKRRNGAVARFEEPPSTISAARQAELSRDFDFGLALSRFDKPAAMHEAKIRNKVEESARLHAINRRDPYMTKLAFYENVLEPSTAGEETSGNEAFDENTTPQAAAPPPLPQQRVSRRSSSKSLKPMGIFGPAGQVQTVSAKQWREIEQLANIELGPNLQQRVENAGRGIAELILDPLSGFCTGDEREGRPLVNLLCGSSGFKGPTALRAGAHLLNRSSTVYAFVPQSDTLPASFEFHLRLFSAAGGKVVRDLAELPVADLVLDALIDTDASGKHRAGPRDGEAAAMLWANSSAAPVLSVGWPSGLDGDSGLPIWSTIAAVSPSATVCLGAVRQGAVLGSSATGALWLVDIGLPSAAYERVEGLESWKPPFGRRWSVTLRYE